MDCEIELRPGDMFRTVMHSPEGRDFPNVGCYLETVRPEKLVWTTALGLGYRPRPPAAQPGSGVHGRHFTRASWQRVQIHGLGHPR